MGVVIDRGATGVHGHHGILERDECFYRARFGVIQMKRHTLDPAAEFEKDEHDKRSNDHCADNKEKFT